MTMLQVRPDTGKIIMERRERWAESALTGQIRSVTEAPTGGRNQALNQAAHRAGRLVAAGLLPAEHVQQALLDAAQTAGLPAQEARPTIRSGFRAGMAAGPADLPRNLQEERSYTRTIRIGPQGDHVAQLGPDRLFPPVAEVAKLWERCAPVWGTTQMEDLCSRGLDPAAVQDLDLARVLPLASLSRWARTLAGTWAETGHHLVVGLYDAAGALRSLHARRLLSPNGESPKGLSPVGFTIKGLVLADSCAVNLLSARRSPWWNGTVYLTEGVPGWLALASQTSDAMEKVPATIGYLNGSWSAEISERIPIGAIVRIWHHSDDVGKRLAANLVATLAHCQVFQQEVG